MQTQQDIRETITIPVDPEPTSFRLMLLAVLFGGVIVGYILTNALFGISSCSLVGIFGGLGFGALSMQLAERFLKLRWKSNKAIHLSYTSINLEERGKNEQIIDPTKEFDVHMWRFEIKRRHRVPKGWYVVAIALEQDDIFLPIFALSSPEDLESLDIADRFSVLAPRKQVERETQDLRLAGKQRRLLRAESARNLDGVEMEMGHFVTYLTWLRTYFPEWMSAAR